MLLGQKEFVQSKETSNDQHDDFRILITNEFAIELE